jgi:hypothetical protein
LYPVHIDASGCKYEALLPETPEQIVVATPVEKENTQSQFEKRAAIESHSNSQEFSQFSHQEGGRRAEMGNAMRESLANISSMPAGQTYSPKAKQVQAVAKCEPQGLIPSICFTPFECL